MNSKLTFRTLTKDDLGQMHRSFMEAFSDYQVNMKMSREAFEDRMLSKVNIDFNLSPGVFSGDKLVGFVFQMVNEYEGVKAAYNGGTGVIPGYLGKGLTAKMYDFIRPKMVDNGIQKCVLEVLQDNQSAINAYNKAGFERTKDFQCLMLKSGILQAITKPSMMINEVNDFDIKEYQALAEISPSMLDQLSQIKCHLEKETILEYRKDNELLGFIIFQPHNGRISQLAVRQDSRRQRIGTTLMQRAHLQSKRKTLSVLNLETKENGVIQFFKRLGFEPDLKQFEMQLSLV